MIGHSDYSGISILDSMLAWYAIPLIGYWIIEQILHHFDYSPTPITIPCQPDLFTSCLNISWLASLSTHLHDSMLALSMCPLFEYWMNGQSHRSSTRFHVSLICALSVWILVDWPVPLILHVSLIYAFTIWITSTIPIFLMLLHLLLLSSAPDRSCIPTLTIYPVAKYHSILEFRSYQHIG